MFHIALYQPEIAPNTGNVIRLAANTGANLHLIHPLGFHPTDKQLRRAGLDYHDWTSIHHHDDFESFLQHCQQENLARIFAISTKGRSHYNEIDYLPNDVFLFGPETRGLPGDVLAILTVKRILRIPMMPNNRSLNLANAVSVIVYEAWRQLGFNGANF